MNFWTFPCVDLNLCDVIFSTEMQTNGKVGPPPRPMLRLYLLLVMFLIICNFQVKFTGFRKLVLRLNIVRIVNSDCYLLIPHIPFTLHSLHLVLTLGTPCTCDKHVKGSL